MQKSLSLYPSLRQLGHKVAVPTRYSSDFLERIARKDLSSLTQKDFGVDLWTLYEVSMRSLDQTLTTYVADLKIPARSPYILESKSVKIYLASLAERSFACLEDLRRVMHQDFVHKLQAPICLTLYPPSVWDQKTARTRYCNDHTQTKTRWFHFDYPHFRSRCPVTQQPDWATLLISSSQPLQTQKIKDAIMEFIDREEFHEMCITSLYQKLKAEIALDTELKCTGRFSRRGGIDINPVRSNFYSFCENLPTSLQ